MLATAATAAAAAAAAAAAVSTIIPPSALTPEVTSILQQHGEFEVCSHEVTLNYSHLSAEAVLKVGGLCVWGGGERGGEGGGAWVKWGWGRARCAGWGGGGDWGGEEARGQVLKVGVLEVKWGG